MGNSDSDTPLVSIKTKDFTPVNEFYATVIDTCKSEALLKASESSRAKLSTAQVSRPKNLLGGHAIRSASLPPNSFGETIKVSFSDLFNPTTQEQRLFIARHAYIKTYARIKHLDAIDNLVLRSVQASIADAKLIETSKADEFIDSFTPNLSDISKTILLIGGAGVGKTTFIDYLQEVVVPEKLGDGCLWVRLDMNKAPLDQKTAYNWICENIVSSIQSYYNDVKFNSLEMFKKIFSVEYKKLEEGALEVTKEYPVQYANILASRF